MTCIRSWLKISLTILPIFGLPQSAYSDEMIVATDDWPPFRISTDNGFSGLDIDLLDELGRRIGEKIRIVKMPWGRGLASMESGAVDIMTGLAYRDERATYIAYTDKAYFQCTSAFYTPKGKAALINTYEDLKKYEVGYVLHSAYFNQFDKDTDQKKIGVPQEQMLIDMVKRNHLDVMIGTDCQVDYFIEQQGLSDVIEKTPYSPGNSVDLFVGISKKSPWVNKIDVFSKIISDMVEEGYVDRKSWEYYGARTARVDPQ